LSTVHAEEPRLLIGSSPTEPGVDRRYSLKVRGGRSGEEGTFLEEDEEPELELDS